MAREARWWIYGHERVRRAAVLAEYNMELCACGYDTFRQNEISCVGNGSSHARDECTSDEFGHITREQAEAE